MRAEGYSAIAPSYDFFTENVNYRAYADRLCFLAGSLGIRPGSLVDLGCGTASLGIELAKRGFDVTGVDISCDMLAVAEKKSLDAGVRLRLINQDMTELSLGRRYRLIISTLDGLNHLDNFSAVRTTLKRVREHLSPGGAFIFDVNTVYKHKTVLGNSCFIFDSDRGYLGWQNDYLGKNRVRITLDLFVPEGNSPGASVWKRRSESFVETAYPVKKLLRALRDSGFKRVLLYDWLEKRPPRAESEKVLFVAV